MAHNYFAPTFLIKVNGQRLTPETLNHISDLTVTHEPDTMDHFSLTLANPYPELPWTHSDKAKEFELGKSIDIQMGYVDDTRPMFSGVITGLTPTFPESGTSTVGVAGYTEMRRLQGSTKTRTFQDVTDKEIAQKIADDVQLTLEADETTTKHAFVIQYRQTDQVFLMERARRIGFRLEVQEKKLIFRQDEAEQSASYTLVWGHPKDPIDPGSRVMPLRNFNPSLSILGQVTEVVVRGQHPTDRSVFEGRAGAGDETQRGGAQSGAQVTEQAFGPRVVELSGFVIASQQEAEDLARSIYNEKVRNFVTGSASTIGLPDLCAGQTVELKGLGPLFSGKYYVTRTVHSINSAGYQTRLDVKRDGIG